MKSDGNNKIYDEKEDVAVYKDMYGFIRDESYIKKEQNERQKNFYFTSKRDQSWVKFLQKVPINKILKNRKDKQLKKLVYQGIPVAFRGPIWSALSGATKMKENSKKTYDMYYKDATADEDVNDDDDDDNANNNKKTIEKHEQSKMDIEKDIFRTFPDHSMFDMNGEGPNQLRRILLAYSRSNSKIGYCQGLNYLTATFLLFMSEEDSFWLLNSMCESILPLNYYTPKLLDLHLDVRVLLRLVQAKLPKVQMILEENRIDLRLITMEWFLCIFLNTLPMETTARIWDVMLYEGSSIIIFRIALGIFKILEPQLEKIYISNDKNEDSHDNNNNVLNVSQYIKNSGKMQFNVEELFKIALNGKCKVTEKEIEKLRKTCRVELQKEIDDIDNRRKKYEEYIKNKSSINEENEKKKKKNEEDGK